MASPAPQVLSQDSFLSPGTQYTMTIECSVLGALENQSGESITAQLIGSCNVDLASAISVTTPLLSPTTYNVTFIYTGDGTDSVADVFQEFASALEDLITNWNYVQCTVGATPGAAGSTLGGASTPCLPSLQTSSSFLWAVAAIGLILVFVISGGPELARQL
jgi:hypothetical protein